MAEIDGESLDWRDVAAVALGDAEVTLASRAVGGLEASRHLVDEISKRGRSVYGITTGIGQLENVSISADQVRELQLNVVRGHSTGVGDPLPDEVLRALLMLRANGLAKGRSGVRTDLVKLLVDMLNARVHPVVPRKGSVGASGDLAPLAHVALVMVGEGEAYVGGRRLKGSEALKQAQLKPLVLQAKEGLAIINSTSLMGAYGCIALHTAHDLLKDGLVAATLSFEALRGSPQPFDPRIHTVRPHQGQIVVAQNLLRLLQASEIIPSHPGEHKVQDPYTLRCIPQVLGPVLDVLREAERVLNIEINSATDNPLVFPDDGVVLNGGNFHGQGLAFVLDFMAIALCTVGTFAERRIARLVDAHLSELPPFLTKESGLNSGFMLAQYTAAALASENKVLAHPASADSIPTSANQEDFVCMGPAAGEKLLRVLDNVRKIVAIEYLCASQGLEFLKPLKPGKGPLAAYRRIRKDVSPLQEDRPLAPDFATVEGLMKAGELVQAAEAAVGPLKLMS